MSGRFSRSLELARASFAVVRADKELMLLPVMSVAALLLILGSLLLPVAMLGGFSAGAAQGDNPAAMVAALVFYVVAWFVALFFNAALVGAAWAVATFLAVPVLVTRDVGPIAAVKESAALLRETWGENLIGNFGLGLVFAAVYVAWMAVCAVMLYLAMQTGAAALIGAVVLVGVVVLLALSALQATMQGVYAAALYRHATHPGTAVPGFAPDLMQNAFRGKS